MLTGDHPATAAAIAAEVGLSLPGAPAARRHRPPRRRPGARRAGRPRRRRGGPGVARGQAAHRPGAAGAWPRAGHDRRRRQRRAGAGRGRHRRGHGRVGHRRGPPGRRPGAARRRLRHHRRGDRARPGDVRQPAALPHLPPHRQRGRAHPVRRVGAERRALPARHRRACRCCASTSAPTCCPALALGAERAGPDRAGPPALVGSAARPRRAAPGVRRARARRGDRWRWARSWSAWSAPAGGPAAPCPTGADLAGRVGRGVHGRGGRPDGQRVRLPLVDVHAPAAGVRHEPAAASAPSWPSWAPWWPSCSCRRWPTCSTTPRPTAGRWWSPSPPHPPCWPPTRWTSADGIGPGAVAVERRRRPSGRRPATQRPTCRPARARPAAAPRRPWPRSTGVPRPRDGPAAHARVRP